MLIDLHKKLSIAVSFGNITPNEFNSILDRYSYFIGNIYFSPTESIRYQTRRSNYCFENTTDSERKEMLESVLLHARSLDIACSITLNAPMVAALEQYSTYLSYIKKYKIDNVTTTIEIAKLIKSDFPDSFITCSYNEAIINKVQLLKVLDSNLFSSIVLGGSFLRDLSAFQLIKERGLKTILMLNTGCSFNCTSFCKIASSSYCANLFKKNIDKYGFDELYARQSTFPEEIKSFYIPSGVIDTYKLASRPISYDELDKLIKSYVSFNSKTFIHDSVNNYHLYGRLSHFSPYYKYLDYDKICSIKQKLWQN